MISIDLFFAVHDSILSEIFNYFHLFCHTRLFSFPFKSSYYYSIPAVLASCFLNSTHPVSSELSQLHLVRKPCVPLTTNHWQWWAFISLYILSSNTRLNNWSPKLIISAFWELEANIWNLFVRNKMNNIFSGVLTCTCTYKSLWG